MLLGELQRDEAPLENNKKKLRWVGVVSVRAGARLTGSAHKALSTTVMCKKR